MPNKRSKDKVILGAYIDRTLKDLAVRKARQLGLNLSDYLIACIERCISQNEKQKQNLGRRIRSDKIKESCKKDGKNKREDLDGIHH